MKAEVGNAKAEFGDDARRRWVPRFSLRTLLIAVTALCILLGGGTTWYRVQEAE